MPRIAQSSIEALKHQINLLDVVSPYVQLKRAGRSWKGLSPFTQEKTPSFYVHPDRGFYKCFSTGEGGDCFTFIMKVENLEFIESVEFLAKKFNIQLQYEEGGPSREELSVRKQLFDLHELATTWFHEQFLQSEEAMPVREYWEQGRGFSMDTAKEIKIGYAPAGVSTFALYCKSKQISLAAMHASGLFFARDRESDYARFKSRFRGRLMIPIRDVQGRVVAFTARQLPQTPEDDPAREAKYVNSPETPIFHKGRILFGMDHARTHLKEDDSFLMVEGQLDAIRCWSVGLHTAIAPQGTAITEEQLHLLRRYEPSHIDCLLDGDRAGRKAALRILPLTFKAGLEFRYLRLPDKADPDDLLREQGAEALEPLRAQACGPIELAMEEVLPPGQKATTQEKTRALRRIFELLQSVPSEVAREDYLAHAARIAQVDLTATQRDYHQYQQSSQPRRAQTTADPLPTQQLKAKDPLLTQAQWELLWLLLHFPEFGQSVSEIIDYEWINTNSQVGQLLSRILAEFREGLLEDTSQLENIIETIEERQLLAELHTKELIVEEPKTEIRKCLELLYRNFLINRQKDLKHRVTNADANDDQKLVWMREVSTIRRELAKPQPIEF
ncbi:DNA primase [Coraliomargarita parva]|uniref:DNA primase n=1 Tax=Coraliomargarita parva TaxID=3014050 RepID=UPI0022B5C60A|nr:DNA primase [Coraliomargarita parva]